MQLRPYDEEIFNDYDNYADWQTNFIEECESDENLLYYDNEADYDIFDYE
jgi:hypothetical protein